MGHNSARYLHHVIESLRLSFADAAVQVADMSHVQVPVEQMLDQKYADKFNALTNSITEGLPREITLRQKQYEYYRDLLLSFPKPDSEAAAWYDQLQNNRWIEKLYHSG